MANCNATSRGPEGRSMAEFISNLRERLLPGPDSDQDQDANRYGRDTALMCTQSDDPHQKCELACRQRYPYPNKTPRPPPWWHWPRPQ
jgi:hypothetical protein